MGSSTRKATASHVSALPDDRLEAIAREIETLQADAILHVAERLAEAREIFRYRRDEGGFGGWVESRLHYSRATAYNVLGIYERFGGECVQYLDTFPASILYLLAAPSTPDEARDEIIQRAHKGDTVPVAEAKRIIEDAKGLKQPSYKTRTRKTPNVEPIDAEDAAARLAAEDAALDPRSIEKEVRKLQHAWLTTSEPAQQKFVQRLTIVGETERVGLQPIEPSSDIGPASTGEVARKDVELEELRAQKRMLEIKIEGLQSEIGELNNANREPASTGRCEICREKRRATQRPVFVCDRCAEIHELSAEAAPPAEDGLDIPEWLDRAKERGAQ